MLSQSIRASLLSHCRCRSIRCFWRAQRFLSPFTVPTQDGRYLTRSLATWMELCVETDKCSDLVCGYSRVMHISRFLILQELRTLMIRRSATPCWCTPTSLKHNMIVETTYRLRRGYEWAIRKCLQTWYGTSDLIRACIVNIGMMNTKLLNPWHALGYKPGIALVCHNTINVRNI